MKNNILLSLFLFITCFSVVDAQSLRWNLYADAGISQSPLKSSIDDIFLEEAELKQAFSWNYGSAVEIKLSNYLFFSTGLQFTIIKNNSEYDYEYNNVIVDGSNELINIQERRNNIFKAAYFSVPLTFKIKSKKLGWIVGGQVARLIKAGITVKYRYLGEPQEGFNDSEAYFEGYLAKYDFGLITGLSYDLSERMRLRSHFYYGLKNVFDYPANPFPSNGWSRKNQQFTLGLSYSL